MHFFLLKIFTVKKPAFLSDTVNMDFLPTDFEDFLAPDCNRFIFLQNLLKKLSIPFSILTLENCNHICIQFPSHSYNPMFKMKIVLVHYDRAVSARGDYITPGANDNSAAVYQVLHWAKKLLDDSITQPGKIHNIRIFFTDGEELASAKEQGSFGLASHLKRPGRNNDDVFVLDGCGRGDVLAVSLAGKNSPASASFTRQFNSLFERACNLVKEASGEKWITIPVPYSDNAGFLACGIPAVALTVLPSEEATAYMRHLQKDKKFARAVMTNGVVSHDAGFLRLGFERDKNTVAKLRELNIDPADALLLSEKLPRTWRIMHTEYDNSGSLTREAFVLTERFLDCLALHKVPV
ncbi:MAG: M28 family peptidase [Spirochaetales bacterium]